MSVTPQDRAFPIFRRGNLRTMYLSLLRQGLRRMIDPDTGVAYAESDIAAATADGTKLWAEGTSLELVELTNQQRALYLADQTRPERASTAELERTHGPARGLKRLPAAGGTGVVRFKAPTGTIFPGSTTKPDPAALIGLDPSGLRYQVFYTATASGGFALLTMSGIDGGNATNLEVGTKIRLTNPPPGVTEEGEVWLDPFDGGAPVESDPDWAARMIATDLYKQGSGNGPQVRDLARKASSSVDDAFVYSCALHGGSSIVCVTQKRGTVVGPTARAANVATLTACQGVLVPPGSVELPGDPFMLVCAAQLQSATLRVYASLPRGRATGWTDPEPWPAPDLGEFARITTLTTQLAFRITTTGPAPQVEKPALMAWDVSTSAWERLAVLSVTPVTSTTYDVVLSDAPTQTLTASLAGPPTAISPDTARKVPIAYAIGNYFDALGPGEVVNLATDPRAHRAVRFPLASDERQSEAGGAVSSFLQEALGPALSGATYEVGNGAPAVPSDPSDGPFLVVAGRVAIYPKPI